MTNTATPVEKWIARTRKTKAEIAAEVGVSPNSLSRYLSGSRFPRPEIVRKFNRISGGEITADSFISYSRASRRG